jgi:hypothetical protein
MLLEQWTGRSGLESGNPGRGNDGMRGEGAFLEIIAGGNGGLN